MRFGLLQLHQLPRPWAQDAELHLVQDALTQAEVAERVGFDHLWQAEHHFLEEHSHASAAAVLLAAASQRTTRLRLGLAGVGVAPGWQHPARLAETVATLDLVSRGRVDLAVGEPSAGVALGGLGIDREASRAAADEALELVARMFVEEPFTGAAPRHADVPPRNVVPKPAQRPHPPLWLTCTRPEMVRAAAERGLGVLCLAALEPDEAASWVAEYRAILASDRCVPAGFSVHPRFAVVLPMHVHEDEQEAIARGIDGAHFAAYALEHYEVFGDHRPGHTRLWEEFVARREDVGFSRDAVRAHGGPLALRVLEDGLASLRGAIGTPEQVRELVGRYADAGVDQVVVAAQTGGTPHEHVVESLELFGREVLPAFRDRVLEVEAQRDADVATAVAAALGRRAAAPALDPTYAVAPMAERRVDVVPGEAAREPEAGGRRRARTRAGAALRASAQARGLRVFKAFVARSDERRLERTIGSARGLRAMFGAMAARFDPAAANGFTGDLRFELRRADRAARVFTVSCRRDGATARPGELPDPAVTLKLSVADFARVAAGELDAGTALLTGRLDLEGDFAVATRLAEMFGQA